MYTKININANIFFLIEDATENINYNDEVVLSIVMNEKKYCIRQDSYIYWIGHMLKHFSESTNYIEAMIDDLGYEYYLYQSEFEKGIYMRDLHEFDNWLAFSGDIAVLFYRKANKLYCQITQNNWGKEYKSLCVQELFPETLNEWKQILS